MTSPQPQQQPAQPTQTTQTEAAETGTTRPEAPPESRDETAHHQNGHSGGKVVHLHTAHPRVTIPYVTPGDMFTGVRGAASRLPSGRKLAYYGMLGGMAVAGALEWPVALAVGAATEVITREQKARSRSRQEEGREQTREAPTTPQAATA
ncbi:hypothetical protein [Streptomyces sp. NPDC002328]|uniref:hypothetical protein n=1 Tax=Streptomyces sp. NPDC002328 TaxID=3364642 RepID=UPI0036AFE9BB